MEERLLLLAIYMLVWWSEVTILISEGNLTANRGLLLLSGINELNLIPHEGSFTAYEV